MFNVFIVYHFTGNKYSLLHQLTVTSLLNFNYFTTTKSLTFACSLATTHSIKYTSFKSYVNCCYNKKNSCKNVFQVCQFFSSVSYAICSTFLLNTYSLFSRSHFHSGHLPSLSFSASASNIPF